MPLLEYEDRQQQDELASEALRLRAEQQQLQRIRAMTELRSQMVREAADTRKFQLAAEHEDAVERQSTGLMEDLFKIDLTEPKARNEVARVLARYPKAPQSKAFNSIFQPIQAGLSAGDATRDHRIREQARREAIDQASINRASEAEAKAPTAGAKQPSPFELHKLNVSQFNKRSAELARIDPDISPKVRADKEKEVTDARSVMDASAKAFTASPEPKVPGASVAAPAAAPAPNKADEYLNRLFGPP